MTCENISIPLIFFYKLLLAFSDSATAVIHKISCEEPQGSIIGELHLLFYVNDVEQPVDCDDSCLVYTEKDINDTNTQLNKKFNSLCD